MFNSLYKVLIVTTLLLVTYTPLHIHTASWSSPNRFFEVEEGGNVQSPILLTDSGGNLHAFWGAALTEDQNMALYHSYWNGTIWSEPIDILVSPGGGSVWPAYLRLDKADYVHAFWSAGSQGFWHSTAHASQVNSAHSWSSPRLTPTADVVFSGLGITQDEKGIWYLAYTNRDLDILRIMSSSDDTLTWSREIIVHREPRHDTWIGDPGVIVAPDGVLWVWWSEFESGSGRNKRVVYARSGDGGKTWNTPEELISGYYSGGFRVIDSMMVRLAAGGVGTAGRYASFSYDNGLTWTEMIDISFGGGGGMQGIDLVIDSADVWHFVIETGGTFASVGWDGDNWLPLEFIVPREELQTCCTTPRRATENASAGISGGDQMVVVFEEADRVLWYTHRLLNAPHTPTHPLQPENEQRTNPKPTATPPLSIVNETSQDVKLRNIDINAPAPKDNQLIPIVIGVLPTAIIVVIFLIVQLAHYKSSR